MFIEKKSKKKMHLRNYEENTNKKIMCDEKKKVQEKAHIEYLEYE